MDASRGVGAMSGTIFISYRRGEDQGFAGRLYDRLERTFRRQQLFMDVDSIAPGQDFVSVLEARVDECVVMLALIGRGWLSAVDAAGRRRLDNPDDFVRIEIAAGLSLGKYVIPVLIDSAPIPRADELPEEIRPLARRNALRLTHDRFKDNSLRLVRALKKVLSEAEGKRRVKEAARGGVAQENGQLSEFEPQEANAEVRRGAEDEANGNMRPEGSRTAPRAIADLAVFRDVDAPWCPQLVIIPAGQFLMGSPEKRERGSTSERPQHRVTIGRRFALGRYPVTFEEYDHFCVATQREKLKDQDWGRGRRPVINVSWQHAVAYCDWLSRQTDKLYRLPSEAEWEYACRAGTTTRYSFGDNLTEGCQLRRNRWQDDRGRFLSAEPMGAVRHARQRPGMGRGRLARQLQGSACRWLGLDGW